MLHTQPKTRSCNKSVDNCNNLLQQANIRMRSHGLRQLVDDKSVARCQQACCKLIVKTCYPQACCKLFAQVLTSLQMKSLLQKFLVDKLQQEQDGKTDNLQQVWGVLRSVHDSRFASAR